MYQKPYTCTEINVLSHFSDLRALILQYNNVRVSTFPEIQKHFNPRERSQSGNTILLSLSTSLYLYEFNKVFGFVKSMIADDFLKLLSVQYLDLLFILYNIVSMSSSPNSHTFFHVYQFSAYQFKQVWCWDIDQMLHFTLEKHKKC